MPCMTNRRGTPHTRQPNRAQLRRERACARTTIKRATPELTINEHELIATAVQKQHKDRNNE